MLGNGRLEALCFDGTKRLCHIRGKLRKKVFFSLIQISSYEPLYYKFFLCFFKVWINAGDIILLGLRDFQVCKHTEIITRV